MKRGTPQKQNAIKLTNFLISETIMKIGEIPEDTQENFNIKIGFNISYNEKLKKKYAINFHVSINSKNANFELKVKAIGIFEAEQNILDIDKNPLVNINSPAILFPFVRSYINTITTNAGITPIILPAYNFSKDKPKGK